MSIMNKSGDSLLAQSKLFWFWYVLRTCTVDAIAGITHLARAVKGTVCIGTDTISMTIMYTVCAFIDIWKKYSEFHTGEGRWIPAQTSETLVLHPLLYALR